MKRSTQELGEHSLIAKKYTQSISVELGEGFV